jgi:DNA-binding MarR family transcriptional regulator
VLVGLSAEGRRLLEGLDAARRSTAEAMLGRLSDADRGELVRLLEAVVACDGGCATQEPRR